MKQNKIARSNVTRHLQAQWELASQRAAEEQSLEPPLGEMLTEAVGLHVKSGVEAGGLWGTTSCTCENSCDCFPP